MSAIKSDYANVSCITFIAENAIIKDTFVQVGTVAGKVKQATAATETIIGVAQNVAAAGDAVKVQFAGLAKVITNGTCAIGEVEVAADGEATTAGGSTAYSVGVAFSAAASDQDRVEVLLACPAVKRPPNA